MGSAAFAVPSLAALLETKHEVVEVVAQPDKPAGRGQHVTSCPVARFAKEMGLALYQPGGVKKPERIEHFKKLAPDLIAVVAYGKILPPELLQIPPLGCVNVHSSLLPKYRGAAPMNWAIVNGETETGVTTMRISKDLDAGDILMAISTPLDECETAVELHDRLAPLGAELLIKTLAAIEDGSAKQTPQDHSSATYAPMIKKEDGHLDWTGSARDIYNRVRGFKPWPGAFAFLDGKNFRIHEAAAVDFDSGEKPGTIIENEGHLAVACGSGTLYLLEVQLEGKRPLGTADFLRGHKIEKGATLT